MKTLAIETSTNVCGVCLIEDDKILYENNLIIGYTHSTILFNEIVDLLNKNNLTIKDINYIAISTGPGSYTGLRIGYACAIGLSKVYNTKIKCVDTLVGLIYNIKNEIDNNDVICAIMDAKADRVYSKYYINNNFTEDKILNINDLITELNNMNISNSKIVFVGDGYVKYYNIIKENAKFDYIANKENLLCKSSSIALASIENYTINDIDKINYMQKSQAERELENNAKNN